MDYSNEKMSRPIISIAYDFFSFHIQFTSTNCSSKNDIAKIIDVVLMLSIDQSTAYFIESVKLYNLYQWNSGKLNLILS